MSYILHLETATPNCSVALSQNGKLLALVEASADRYLHAEKLHEFIQEVLRQGAVRPSALAAVSVSEGPGSYTGLRIGVAAAKGLCFSLGIPMIAILTNAVLANQAIEKYPNHTPIALTDARRMEVYATTFSKGGVAQNQTTAVVLAPDSFAEWYAQAPLVFIGDGAAKYAEVYTGPEAVFENTFPSAAFLVQPATQAFDAKKFVNLAHYEPFYLKNFEAGPRKKIF